MTQAILYLTDKENRQSFLRFSEEATNTYSDVFVLFHQKNTHTLTQETLHCQVIPFTSDILFQSGYKPIGDSLVPGNAQFPLLRFFVEYPHYDYYWVIEDDVCFSDNWAKFFKTFDKDASDLLASYITHYNDDTTWTWWYTFSSAGEAVKLSDMVRSFNPIYRLSNRALKVIHEKMSRGWSGHFEVLIPTILSTQGMKMTDLGNNKNIDYVNNEYSFYDRDTMSHMPLRIQAKRQGMIYHPIKEKISEKSPRRNCVISAVGRNSLHRHWLKGADNNRSFDLHLIVYDNSFGTFYNEADYLSYKKGFKLKLVYDYLKMHPEYIDRYNYFFIPDDDILTSAMEIERLFEIMDAYHLHIAQPALRQSYYTHPLTLRKPLALLRYVNFVEMMLPCFSKKALMNVLESFNANESGWGVEYHWAKLIKSDKKDMAIIDAVAMQHTQPVKQGRTDNLIELQKYITENSLSLRQDEYDCILDPSLHATEDQYLYATKSIQALQMIARKLLIRLKSGEIRKLGLDGQAGIALLLNEASYITEDKSLKDIALGVIKYIKSLSIETEQQETISWVEKCILLSTSPLKEDMCLRMLEMSDEQFNKFKTELFLTKATGWNIVYNHFRI